MGARSARSGVCLTVELVTAFLGEQPDVDAGWLFGSEAQGAARPDSDVDVALLFAGDVSNAQAVFRRGIMMDDLRARLGRRVDVLDVARVSPRVFASVMRHARLLFERNPAHRVEALARQYAFWQDMQEHYRLQRESLKAFFG